jgi:hypothetical protein
MPRIVSVATAIVWLLLLLVSLAVGGDDLRFDRHWHRGGSGVFFYLSLAAQHRNASFLERCAGLGLPPPSCTTTT